MIGHVTNSDKILDFVTFVNGVPIFNGTSYMYVDNVVDFVTVQGK